MLLRKIFSRKWLITTALVLLGAALCIRLGIWQLDRLKQRRIFNAQVTTMRALPPLDLNADQPQVLTSMEWRRVTVSGTYDFANQIALRNQYNGNQYGFHLVTPLRLSDGRAVLVDRGWIPPDENSTPADWRKYDEPAQATVTGQIRLGRSRPDFGGVADALPLNGEKLMMWNNPNVEGISGQSPYPLLPIYIQPNVDPSDTVPPIPFQPTVDLTEGPHMGYALQWFTFSLILLAGYPFYLRKQEM